MKKCIFRFLLFSLISFCFSAKAMVSADSLPCLYGVKAEGECNEIAKELSQDHESTSRSGIIIPEVHDNPCLCGIDPDDDGACLPDCAEAEVEEPVAALRRVVVDSPCEHGIRVPGECNP